MNTNKSMNLQSANDCIITASTNGLTQDYMMLADTGSRFTVSAINTTSIQSKFGNMVEVIRCKECFHWRPNCGYASNSPTGHCFCHDITTTRLDFCSYGKER